MCSAVKYGLQWLMRALSLTSERLMLTVELKLTSQCLHGVQEKGAQRSAANEMRSLVKTLPPYVWLVALPQLTSRICHPHRDTQTLMQHLLTRITAAFPQQARQLP